jgi:pimeloyl-ACP methyl ester carboxylesterase
MIEQVHVAGTTLELERLGSGPRLVFLHGEDGTLLARPFLEALAEGFEVIVPSHPGWGGSERPAHVTSIDDIAYLYLDLLAGLDEHPVPVVGVSIGAWIALEAATKSQADIASLALVAPIGIKVRGRDDRDLFDLYAEPAEAVAAALYGDAERAPDLRAREEGWFHLLALAQEAVARYAWQPYMHNPKLLGRVGRIDVPTLVVSGADDRFVYGPEYYRALAAAIEGCEEVVLRDAGHRVEEQCPHALAHAVSDFISAALPTQ